MSFKIKEVVTMATFCKVKFRGGYLTELIALAESLLRSPITVTEKDKSIPVFSYQDFGIVYPKDEDVHSFWCRTLFPSVKDSIITFHIEMKKESSDDSKYSSGYYMELLYFIDFAYGESTKVFFNPFELLAKLYGFSEIKIWDEYDETNPILFREYNSAPYYDEIVLDNALRATKNWYYSFILEHCSDLFSEKMKNASHSASKIYEKYWDQETKKMEEKNKEWIEDFHAPLFKDIEVRQYAKEEYENYLCLLAYFISEEKGSLAGFCRKNSLPIFKNFIQYVDNVL